ncbi:type II secretion system secretin GspD [Marinobacterium sp. D7]|uniref:type II secretion system secretin GspD n=1 Tax=Marinobacterium ramblicola TaxID=2849041 RepID=UPI001C2DABED|nr:type II secretion system secretin GspD [Marinobacterium ramblicola]MBV1787973.1 type II secretion system secretin GspD [Marinobacterium ramblicola]
MNTRSTLVLVLSCALLLSSCALTEQNDGALDSPFGTAREAYQYTQRLRTGAASSPVTEGDTPRFATEGQQGSDAPPLDELYGGNGQFFNLSGPGQGIAQNLEGDITFNFQGVEIGEVVKTILGDILQRNYILDERVHGLINMQTSQPLSRAALIPTLEKLLQVTGAILIDNGSFYDIVPADDASGGALAVRTKLTADKGYQMLVVPLRYIAAQEMLKILEPLKPRQGVMESDDRRNLLLLAGTQAELANLRETINLFDVDQLQGMSVGLFRLQSVEAEQLVSELEAVFGADAEGPLAGLVSFLPIERLNAIMVITPQRKYLHDAQVWIRRLDRSEGAQGLGMYVYYVQNGKAESLAELLQQLFDSRQRSEARNAAERSETPAPAPAVAENGEETDTGAVDRLRPAISDISSVEVEDVSIIADSENNALLIMASPEDYDKVYKAIQKLDVLPLQVLVEATIVEVSLEDDLQYGLQWFFKNHFGGGKRGVGTIGSGSFTSPTSFSEFGASAGYEILDAAGTRALLNLLARDSRINVISSPSLMVLDNRTATIQVGDQVPVRTSETTNTSSESNITSTIQFRDTGVMLEVTPRVNAGGMVVLDIAQEVNDVAQTTTSDIDSPTITQRRIETSVAVQSGETLVLGGLIRETRQNSGEGVPLLRHVPIIGLALGSRGKSVNRTELVVLITPTAVSDREEARQVTQEYQRKLSGLELPRDDAEAGNATP